MGNIFLDQFANFFIPPQDCRLPLAEADIQLISNAVEAGRDKDAGYIHQQFQFHLLVEFAIILEQFGDILEAGFVENQESLTGNPGADESLANRGDRIVLVNS